MQTKHPLYKRVVLLIMDGCGCGATPDAKQYGDEASNTLGHISRAVPGMALPHFTEMGLGNITPMDNVPSIRAPHGAVGRLRQKSMGKDTTTGHWELCGLVLSTPFPTFPNGFPSDLLKKFEQATNKKTIGNIAISGTTVLEKYGAHHMRTGDLIVYTSADSVFQIAAHEDVVPVQELYKIGEKARMLCDAYGIGRVIVRPFVGKEGGFTRTYNRKDFSMKPFGPTVLDSICAANIPVIGIGKIGDIFANQGITQNIHTEGNRDGLGQVLGCLDRIEHGLIFCNLVDFDMLYGHRRDVAGYAKALEEVDAWLPALRSKLQPTDLVLITSDHGNDPTFPGTDHTREDVPLLMFGHQPPKACDLGIGDGFYTVAQTLCDAFGLPPWNHGESFLPKLFS